GAEMVEQLPPRGRHRLPYLLVAERIASRSPERPGARLGFLLSEGAMGRELPAPSLDITGPHRSTRHMDRFPDVMILAAGLGTRMRPLTDDTPKPLIKLAGRPLLDRVAALAHSEGATRFVINAHHHAGQMKPHVMALDASL